MSAGEIVRVEGWDLARGEEGEPLVRDLDLALRLGYERPHKIRELIKRMERAGTLEGVYSESEKTAPLKGGRPGTAYYLTEAQAVLVAARSDTPRAVEVTREVVAVYVAWRRGLLTPAPAPGPSPEIAELRAQLAALTASVTALVRLSNRAPAPALEGRREVSYRASNQRGYDPRQGTFPADPLSRALALDWGRWDAWYASTVAERLSGALGVRVSASEVWRAAERLGWHVAHSRGAEWRPGGWVYLRGALPVLVREILRGGL